MSDSMDQITLIISLIIAFASGFFWNLMAINANFSNTWSYLTKDKIIYTQSIIHGGISAVIFFILIEILKVNFSIGEVPLQNNYIFALLIGLISKPLYDYEFFTLPISSSDKKKFSISSFIPIVKQFDNQLYKKCYNLIRADVDIRCKKYSDFTIVKDTILKNIPEKTPEAKVFEDDVNNGKYDECWEIMYHFIDNFGTDSFNRIFPVP
jgi:hypothetical protein